MDVGELKRQIKFKTPNKFYIFTGNESKVQDIYIHRLASDMNMELKYVDSAKEALVKQSSLFNVSTCYVCRDDKELIKAEKHWDDIDNLLGNNILIFILTEVDKRTKFYKHFKDIIVEFNYLSDDLLYKYITKEIELTDTFVDTLITVCEQDYGRALLEIDKIKQYCKGAQVTPNKAFSELLQSGVLHIPPEDAIFKWCDAVLKNDTNAFNLLGECYKIGEPPLRLLLVLYTNAKKVLLVQACTSKDVEEVTGLSSWDIKCTRDKIGCWSIGELVDMLRLINKVETALKTGKIDTDFAMDYVMCILFGGWL